MKKIILILVVFLCLLSPVLFSDETSSQNFEKEPSVIISPDFLPMLVGVYSAKIEYKMGEHLSLEFSPIYFNPSTIIIIGPMISQSGLDLWIASLRCGLNYYLKKAFNSVFIGAYVKGGYVNFSYFSSYDDTSTGFGSVGAGGIIGQRWTSKYLSFAYNVGVEYNLGFSSVSYSDSSLEILSYGYNGFLPVLNMSIGFAF